MASDTHRPSNESIDTGGRLPVEAALEMLAARLEPVVETESVSLTDAQGRICADDRVSPIDLPPFPSSAMDGVALRGAELDRQSRFRLAGTALAGHPFEGTVAPGEAVRLFTGAVVPPDLDTVVIQENVRFDDAWVHVEQASAPGANVREAGNDVSAGDAVVHAGDRLNAFKLGALYATGHQTVTVKRRLRVAVFSTGDELVAPGQDLAPGQIYDSNRFMLSLLLDNPSVQWRDAGVLPDEPDAIEAALSRLAEDNDVVITSGGVSVGDADYVRGALEKVGSIDFYRLNLKPGKPLAYGRIERPGNGHAHFFGLPGNPVSTLVTGLLIVQPSLRRLAGERTLTMPLPISAIATSTFAHRPGREEYQRGIVARAEGELTVRSTGDQGSNRLMSFASANALVRIPADTASIESGQPVDVLLLSGTLMDAG